MYRLIVEGAPRTKKNSLRRLKRGHRVFTVGSEAHKLWADKATWQLRSQWRQPPLTGSIGVRAAIYRATNVGDLVGYLQAIGDVLEGAGVIENDRLICSWDGSRLFKDAAHPRIELEIHSL